MTGSRAFGGALTATAMFVTPAARGSLRIHKGEMNLVRPGPGGIEEQLDRVDPGVLLLGHGPASGESQRATRDERDETRREPNRRGQHESLERAGALEGAHGSAPMYLTFDAAWNDPAMTGREHQRGREQRDLRGDDSSVVRVPQVAGGGEIGEGVDRAAQHDEPDRDHPET